MNMKEWIGQVISQPARIAVPIMTHPGIELIGKSVFDAVTDGRVHVDAISALDGQYPSAACTVIMDLTVEAEAFGAKVTFHQDEIPTITGRLVSGHETVRQLKVPDLSRGRLGEYLLANRLAAARIQTKPVLGGCIGPFSLAGRLYDMSEIMMGCYLEPETIKTLLSTCCSFLVNYARAIKEQGVQGIIIAEPAAGLLPNEGCAEFSSAYIRPIVEAVQDDEFAVILHNCGNTGHCTKAMLETGAAGYHFGNMIDMEAAAAELPGHVLAMGNLDPVGLFKSATPDQVKKATISLLDKMASYPNFVLSSGCDVPPHAPEENINAFYQALEEYNQRSSRP